MWRTGETENLLWKQIVELHVMEAQGVILVSQKHPLHVTAAVKNNIEVNIRAIHQCILALS